MKMVKEYKKEIIIGVLLICLQPLFNNIGNLDKFPFREEMFSCKNKRTSTHAY